MIVMEWFLSDGQNYCNQVIALVLVVVGFLIGSKKW